MTTAIRCAGCGRACEHFHRGSAEGIWFCDDTCQMSFEAGLEYGRGERRERDRTGLARMISGAMQIHVTAVLAGGMLAGGMAPLDVTQHAVDMARELIAVLDERDEAAQIEGLQAQVAALLELVAEHAS